MTKRKVNYENILYEQIKLHQLPLPLRQVSIPCEFEWRCDFVWMKQKLIVEIDGGAGVRWYYNPVTKEKKPYTGSHTTMKGFEKNKRQDAAAFKAGFIVLRLTPSMVGTGIRSEAVTMISDYINKLNKDLESKNEQQEQVTI